ncbi:unnamed protein product [Cuscuta campestris]|uniref:Auxin-responsive protein n=1 Tax=Cuscuta campestris TaxID=132261 RepID=A0A484MFT1_9ASTE|nr:unnamed protein product [Cuscuta campestris]
MRNLRGFSVKQRVTAVFRCDRWRRRRSPGLYQRLDPPATCRVKLIPSILSLTRNLKSKAKAICTKAQYFSGPSCQRPAAVPKGHLAVYVGRREDDFERVLVPVMCFNHPLFGELLRDVEEEFGFSHPGGITIPCRISEFERVRTRIMEGEDKDQNTKGILFLQGNKSLNMNKETNQEQSHLEWDLLSFLPRSSAQLCPSVTVHRRSEKKRLLRSSAAVSISSYQLSKPAFWAQGENISKNYYSVNYE